jgi:formate hydrogenlyase transcriptional activator
MILRKGAMVKRSFTIPELHPRPVRTGTHRPPSASNGGLAGRQEARPQDPAISPGAEASDRTSIRILSVDNHPPFRERIATIINQQPDMMLVSQASTLREAIQQYREHQPDITLMEIWLPDLGGVDALFAIRAEFPAARVIIFTTCDGDVEVPRALEAGAGGYLLKSTPPSELLQEIRKVHSGRKGVQPQLAAKLAEHIGEDTLNGARRLRYRFAEGGKISTALQIAFEESEDFGVSPKDFQLLSALTLQATRSIELRALIEECIEFIGRALHCDCAYIALLDPENPQMFREFALQYPHRNHRLQQSPLISREEARWLSRVVELGQSVSFAGAESESRSVAGVTGFKAQCHLPLVNRGRGLGVLTLACFAEDAFPETEIPFLEQVAAQIAIAIENARAHDQIAVLKEQLEGERVYVEDEILAGAKFEEIVGSSESLVQALGHVARVAPTDSTVLITGESGTGKELVARAIHKRSRRADKPFIRVNCAAIPQSLMASELFGHEKGAFTGATERRLGRFELANGGTIFLDEIGDIPADTQVALLRVLQEREFERVGGGRTVSVDVRVVAATNRDLKAAVEAGAFRLDLFYRLNVFPIRVPSLREREDDIPLLAKYFIERYARSTGKKIKNINRKTLDLLQAYDWPGNIRELQNVIERAVILCDRETLSIDESCMQRETLGTLQRSTPLSQALTNTEKAMIEAALEDTGGRVSGPSGAAVKLGIPRSTLESRIRSLQINKHLFRSERTALSTGGATPLRQVVRRTCSGL